MLYVWVCYYGHESVHSDDEIRSLRVHPRCPRPVKDDKLCGANLNKRVRKFKENEEE